MLMKTNKSAISKIIIRIIAGCIVITYFLSCLTPYINPSNGFVWTFMALGFPVIFLLMALVVVISLLINKKVFFISLLILMAGYKNINSSFAYHVFNPSIFRGKTIKVLSWNIDNILNTEHPLKPDRIKREKVISFIKTSEADIVCLQDNAFCVAAGKKITDDITEMKLLGYPYFVLSEDFKTEKNKSVSYGTGIFSKYPIVGNNKINYKGNYYESLLYVDLNIKGKIIRVFTTHLRSMRLPYEIYYPTEEYTMSQDDTADILYKSVFHKLIYFDKKHSEQSITAKKIMDSTKIPYILCADLNSVPASFVYHHISDGLNDIFLKVGSGFGNTYSKISPTLRIDVVLTSPTITPLNYSSPRLVLSDHYPVIATIGLP